MFFIACAALFVVAAASCRKQDASSCTSESGTISFRLVGEGLEMSVKSAAVTSLTSVNWGATSGTRGNDVLVYAPSAYAVSGGVVNTGLYWPKDETSYIYYASNADMVWNASSHSMTIAATNGTDIVSGTVSAPYKSEADITLDHIYARTGSLTLNAQDGYTIVGDSVWKIESNAGAGIAGTYDVGASAWLTNPSPSALASQIFTSNSDLYLIPGSYKITITYTLQKGAFVKEYTKSADVILEANTINNIVATAHVGNDGASEVVFNVSISEWTLKEIIIPVTDLN